MMIVLISPAKSLDFSKIGVTKHSVPRLLKHSEILIKTLKKKSSEDLKTLMKVSDNIATLNATRYKSYSTPFSLDNAKQAIFAFTGDVYKGLDVASLNTIDLDFANEHLRILSGLYGVLKPLDLIQPYRLEMGTKLQNKRGKNLYEFWNTRIARLLNEDLAIQGDQTIINLASNEYFKSVDLKSLKGTVYNIVFKEERNSGEYKIIAFYAKKARGMMCNFIIKNRLTKPKNLKAFDMDGYLYNEALSSDKELIFTR